MRGRGEGPPDAGRPRCAIIRSAAETYPISERRLSQSEGPRQRPGPRPARNPERGAARKDRIPRERQGEARVSLGTGDQAACRQSGEGRRRKRHIAIEGMGACKKTWRQRPHHHHSQWRFIFDEWLKEPWRTGLQKNYLHYENQCGDRFDGSGKS